MLKDFSILVDSGTCENFGFLPNKTSGITVCQCLVRCCKSLLGRFIWDLFLSVLKSRLDLVLKYVSVFSKYCKSVIEMPFCVVYSCMMSGCNAKYYLKV